MSLPPIEEIEHTADWAIRVRGRDMRELFVNAARGMFGLLADLEGIEPHIERHIGLQEYDAETLLVSWLSELLWLNEERDLVFVQYDIKTLTLNHLEARVQGDRVPNPSKPIKAVTFHDLEIMETDGAFEVTLVFDV
jgi:SHS2 domain-containing protein